MLVDHVGDAACSDLAEANQDNTQRLSVSNEGILITQLTMGHIKIYRHKATLANEAPRPYEGVSLMRPIIRDSLMLYRG